MQIKFDKYSVDYSFIQAMGEILDLGIKPEMLEVSYNKLDISISGSKIEELKERLKNLNKV